MLYCAAPLGLKNVVETIKPRACALGYERVSPLQGSLRTNLIVYLSQSVEFLG